VNVASTHGRLRRYRVDRGVILGGVVVVHSFRLLGPVVAVAVTCLVLGCITRRSIAALTLDQPNARSLHTQPIPRTGGVAIVLGFLAGGSFSGVMAPPFAIAAALAIVSFLDDFRSLPAILRLVVHLFAATAAVATVGVSWGVRYPLLVLCVAWMTNLYNFMDGSDGLAGGMAVFGFGTYAVGAWSVGAIDLVLMNICVGSATAAFLTLNFPPARVFMGDVGSIPLGFLAAAIGVEGWSRGLWPIWFPVVVFAPFVVDASVTLLKRALRGDRVWHAHREHYYQRLILTGWSHRKVATIEYAFMAMSGVCALATLRLSQPGRFATLALFAGVFALAMWFIDARWRRRGSGAVRCA
jgi:UDP-GlcNAc:undecaprenyl-phosphate/decaprenyl-phosphate GlcNAc-1-phosphate transferase